MTARSISTLRSTTIALAFGAGITVIACRQQTVPEPPGPALAAWPHDEHCWWTAIRTTLPIDTVGARFAKAFASVGLTDVRSQRIGDTVLVRGGPTELDDVKGRARFASRAVAYQVGDSTRLRWYSSIVPRAEGAAAAEVSNLGERTIPFCGAIGKAVAISGFTTHDPTADDSIAVWGRVP